MAVCACHHSYFNDLLQHSDLPQTAEFVRETLGSFILPTDTSDGHQVAQLLLALTQLAIKHAKLLQEGTGIPSHTQKTFHLFSEKYFPHFSNTIANIAAFIKIDQFMSYYVDASPTICYFVFVTRSPFYYFKH